MPPPSEDLVEGLKKLRIGTGLHTNKIADRPQLIEALGVSTAIEAYQRIRSLVHDLGEGVPARALRAAYAIDYSSHHLLKGRRREFGVSIDRIDEGTIMGYEDQAIGLLVAKILSPVIRTVLDPRAEGYELLSMSYSPVIDDGALTSLDILEQYRHPADRSTTERNRRLAVTVSGLGREILYMNPVGARPETLYVVLKYVGSPQPSAAWVDVYDDLDLLNIGHVGRASAWNHQVGPAQVSTTFEIRYPSIGHVYAVRWKFE